MVAGASATAVAIGATAIGRKIDDRELGFSLADRHHGCGHNMWSFYGESLEWWRPETFTGF